MAEPASAAAIDAALAGVLPEHALFAVGGRVRDEVRSELDGIDRTAKDLDYVVVGVALDELVSSLRKLGPADVVGSSFAVVKTAIGGITVDVALPRREHSTGPGHRDFAVDWGPDVSLADDLARRDFRMNMLARAVPGGALVDPYGGAADIAARRIDVLREEAFVEDPLRMLRACQFAARFDYQLTPKTLSAMQRAMALVETVSPERIHDELAKLLENAARPSAGIDLMREGGLLRFVLPEVAEGIGVSQNRFHAYDVYEHSLATLDATPPGDVTLRLSALLHDVGKPRSKTVEDGEGHFYRHEIIGADMAQQALSRLCFSGDQIEAVSRLVRNHMYLADPDLEAKTIRRFINRVGRDLLERQFALRAADIVGSGLPPRGDSNHRFEERVRAVLAEKPPLSVRDLSVTGVDALKILESAGAIPRGAKGDARIGPALRGVLEDVMDNPTLAREAQLALLKQHLTVDPQAGAGQ
jgi:putative nucleotidyltransferase with HDIG domain